MKVERKGRRWKWAIASFVILVIAGTVFAYLPLLLVAPAQTVPADVILHFAAASRRTYSDDHVVQLYQQKLAKKIVCISRAESCGVYAADETQRRLVEMGIPAEDVLTLYLPREECVAPALPRMIEMMKAQGWQQALMVLPPTRTRSTGSIARKHFQHAGLQLAVTYSPQAYEGIATRWWANHQKAQAATEAIISMVLDPLYPECR